MSNLIQPYDEDLAELLSAYLDGQLTPDETERVERRLAEDPESRGLLEQLRQVSQRVHNLPVSTAPAELADEVMQQLERDALLGMTDAPSEIAGRSHLRVRRFAAAAAILILAGAVITIVYSVLFKPSTEKQPEEMPEGIMVSQLPKKHSEPTEPDTPVAREIHRPAYSQVHLVLKSLDPASDSHRLNRHIGRLDIENPITQPLHDNETTYVFMCSVEQLHEIFTDLKGSETTLRIDAWIHDKERNSLAAIYHVSESQLLALSRETDSTARYELAMNYHQSNVDTLWQFLWESYLPNLYILGPSNEGTALLPLTDTPESPAMDPDSLGRETPTREPEEGALALVGVQITIREEEVFPVTMDPAGTDPNFLTTPVEPKSQTASPDPNALNP